MRSKEEILRENASVPKPQVPGVLEAMDTYAAQSVAEFKERLKEAIRYDLTISMGNADKFITLIDETK